jgi:dTDP-4-dehydrorhamnose reductase
MTRLGSLPLWGGMECTVNRVNDAYFDQFEIGGHYGRPDDLERIAALGIRTLRYPVVWERHDAGAPSADEAWLLTDERLQQMRSLGIRPIIGLVHHGSGPQSVCMTESSFSDGVRNFARIVAERYPWIDAYTPVNEPLTTARFAALYGHWHPHGRDDLSFVRAFFQECRAVVLAMQAIREVRSDAQLIQTEDLGQTHSTERLRYQADFENERRWATFDLLCGRVDLNHPMWGFFLWCGADERDLKWFLDHPCPPDVLGLNHYLTSERWLDERLERYPVHTHGGNGKDRYADVEAVRVSEAELAGTESLLRQTWRRYSSPIAITEAHLGCTREEQLRWLRDVWDGALRAREAGVDVQAVTAWSLFGSYDWDTLVTRRQGHYEPGAFDVRCNPPRATASAKLLSDLSRGRRPSHPILDDQGWWRRPERILFPQPGCRGACLESSRLILITGATGTLGQAFARLCDVRGLAFRVLRRSEMDIADPESVRAAIERHRPWAIVNAAGYVRVDDAETDVDRCRRENTTGPATLASACAEFGVAFVTFSSDLVFDGRVDRPYLEHDEPAPLNMYGRSKAEAEKEVLKRHPDALIIRTSAFFGPWDEHNFVYHVVRTLRGGSVFVAADDMVVTPSYVPDLGNATLDLLIDGEHGVWHVANPDPVTWKEFAEQAAHRAGFDAKSVVGRPACTFGWCAPRPHYSALGSGRGVLLPSLSRSLDQCFSESLRWVGL